ncbi:hypothetical protein LCGC14_0534240 [marine sediment metagenome]|uniref:Uncharacterized protein n=1 Tax=marine sediment metagenome TaxID=412755 RepID=A0A0F9RUT8_9ZZZZ
MSNRVPERRKTERRQKDRRIGDLRLRRLEDLIEQHKKVEQALLTHIKDLIEELTDGELTDGP